jgi:hypothetical protein
VDVLDAALRQLADHGDRLALVDAREAEHFQVIGQRLAELGTLVTGLGETVRDQAAILTALQGLDEQVAALTAQMAGHPPDGDGDTRQYRPSPAPRWWKLHGRARDEALAKLTGWVEQVYQPGYGQLAASLGPCWHEHPLCWYALDILSELWSVLYLADKRTPAVLSAQAEYQARILPALAEQMVIETRRCGHPQRGSTVNGTAIRSRP